MGSIKDLRVKIVTTKKTQQTTKAMKVVSAAKLKKAQHNIVNARPYALSLRKLIKDLSLSHQITHPLLSDSKAEEQKTLLVVLSSDRGLCGGLNTNINKYTAGYLEKNRDKNIDIIFVGRKAADFFKNRGVVAKKVILNLVKEVGYSLAADFADELVNEYLEGNYSEVRFIYNEFKSALAQEVIDEKILPVDANEEGFEASDQGVEFLFEPSPEQILEDVLEKHFAIQVHRCFQESVASEHGARMTAMENATKNAGEMIGKLTLEYNKARQAKITTELIEITSGAEAL